MGMLFICLMMVIFGCICYLGYGSATQEEITLNLPQGTWETYTIISIFIIAVYTSYPVQMFPIIQLMEGAMLKRFEFNAYFQYIRNLCRTIMVMITVVLAISIPHFSLFISLVGAVGASLLAFILPTALHLKLVEDCSKPQRILNYILLGFGICASVLSTGVTLYELVDTLFLS